MTKNSTSTAIQKTPTLSTPYDQKALAPKAVADALVIKTKADADRAGQLKAGNRALRQEIAGWFSGTPQEPGPKALSYRAWQSLCQKETELLKPLEEADKIIGRKLGVWMKAEEERAAQIAAAAQEAARKQAEEERIAQALALEAESVETGDVLLQAAADEMLNLPLDVPVMAAAPVKVDGVYTKKQTVLTVTDPVAMICALAAGAMLDRVPEEGPHRAAIETFLTQFAPFRDGLVNVRTDKNGQIVGVGPCDVYMTWIRAAHTQRGAAFALAGVRVTEDDKVI